MAILSYQEISDEIAAGRLVKNGSPNNVQACSYDMRVGTIFLKTGSEDASTFQHIVEPGEIISLFTQEELLLPANIAATAFAMNSLSSQGLLVLNPGHVDPGYEGPLTVRAINMRATPKAIKVGMPIFTIVFDRLDQPTTRPYSHNKPLGDRKMEFGAIDVEQNAKSIYNLARAGAQPLILTAQDVREEITRHWLTWITVIAAIVAAVFSMIAVFKGNPAESDQQKPHTQTGLPDSTPKLLPPAPVNVLSPPSPVNIQQSIFNGSPSPSAASPSATGSNSSPARPTH